MSFSFLSSFKVSIFSSISSTGFSDGTLQFREIFSLLIDFNRPIDILSLTSWLLMIEISSLSLKLLLFFLEFSFFSFVQTDFDRRLLWFRLFSPSCLLKLRFLLRFFKFSSLLSLQKLSINRFILKYNNTMLFLINIHVRVKRNSYYKICQIKLQRFV